jgi:hypothetical protein
MIYLFIYLFIVGTDTSAYRLSGYRLDWKMEECQESSETARHYRMFDFHVFTSTWLAPDVK